MENKNVKAVALLTYVCYFVFAIMSLILAIQGLDALKSSSGILPSSYISAFRSSLIVTLIGIIGVILILLIGVGKSLTGSKSFVSATSSVLTVLTFADLLSAIILMGATSTSGGALVIVGIVFEVIAFLLSIASVFYCATTEKGKDFGVTGFAASLIMFVIQIITLATNAPSGALAILKAVFLMLSLVMSLLGFGMLTYYQSNKPSAQQVSSPLPQPSEPREVVVTPVSKEEPKVQPSSDDPVAQLEKLKNLLDKGVITKEEYEEKRKKYVDML